MGVAAVEIAALARARQLLAVGEFPQDAHGIGIGAEAFSRQQEEIQTLGGMEPERKEIPLDLFQRKDERINHQGAASSHRRALDSDGVADRGSRRGRGLQG